MLLGTYPAKLAVNHRTSIPAPLRRELGEEIIIAKWYEGCLVLVGKSEFDALLTGDIGPNVADEVVKQLAASGVERVEYLKIPHHGSKNGLTENLLKTSEPKLAVISVGKNSYGHPHKEILDMPCA